MEEISPSKAQCTPSTETQMGLQLSILKYSFHQKKYFWTHVSTPFSQYQRDWYLWTLAESRTHGSFQVMLLALSTLVLINMTFTRTRTRKTDQFGKIWNTTIFQMKLFPSIRFSILSSIPLNSTGKLTSTVFKLEIYKLKSNISIQRLF